MLDPDVPPEAEGNTDGGVGVVHPAAEAAVAVPQWAAIVRIMEASTPPPWTTATELTCKGAENGSRSRTFATRVWRRLQAGRSGSCPWRPCNEDSASRIFAFVDDLFLLREDSRDRSQDECASRVC